MHVYERLPAASIAVLPVLSADEPLPEHARFVATELTAVTPELVSRAILLILVFALLSCHVIPPSKVIAEEGLIDAGSGVRLGYRKVGSGPETIVVLHGGPGFTMDYLADDLLPLATRHTVIFYDQRGTGRSTLVSDAAPSTRSALPTMSKLFVVTSGYRN